MIIFAAVSPHPPILLPEIGSKKDRLKVKKTIESLEILSEKIKKENPDKIIISSPHPDWGIKVPLRFLNSKIKNQNAKLQFKIQNYQNPANLIIKQSDNFTVYPLLTTFDSPRQHFEWGKEFYLKIKNLKLKIAVIASGDLSHCLKKEGPYGFRADGPKFDEALVKYLKEKNITDILNLNESFPEAGECGLRSFCFILGILEAQYASTGAIWQPEILSYEAPFGVGYLVAYFHINNKAKWMKKS